jgi:hypothetical protein
MTIPLKSKDYSKIIETTISYGLFYGTANMANGTTISRLET